MIYLAEKKIIMENCQKILDHLENWRIYAEFYILWNQFKYVGIWNT